MWFLLARLRYLTNGSTLLQAELELPSVSIKPVIWWSRVSVQEDLKSPNLVSRRGHSSSCPPVNFVAAGQYLGVVEK